MVTSAAVQVVGAVLVHNEDVHVERAVRNVVDLCDRIHVVDHLSNDATPEIVRELAREFDHIDVRRTWDASVSHRVLEPYVGTKTWAIAAGTPQHGGGADIPPRRVRRRLPRSPASAAER